MAESSCTTLILSIVNLSMCYSGAPLREQRKTLQNYKFYLKPANFSRYFFQLFFGSSEALGPRRTVCALAGPPSQKRVQSYTFPPFPPNIFPKKFIKTMFSSIHLTSICNCQNCIPDTIFTQRPVYSIDKAKSQKSSLRRDRTNKISKKIKFSRMKYKMHSRKLIKISPSFLPPGMIQAEIKRTPIAPPHRIL